MDDLAGTSRTGPTMKILVNGYHKPNGSYEWWLVLKLYELLNAQWMAEIQQWEQTASSVEETNNPEPGAENPKARSGLNAMGRYWYCGGFARSS